MKIREFIIMPHTADQMGLIHKPGRGPNNRFDFKNKGNNRANELEESKRIPRKKGQPANSKKHSDLYTDENPKGTIHGLGFKDEATARASVSKIKKSGRSHAHKIQAAVAMEQRAKAAGKAGPAAVYRKFINSMKKKTKSKQNEEAAGVGIITKQNTTPDVKPGETTRQANKLGLGLTKKGVPARSMREQWEAFQENFADGKKKGKSRPGRVKRSGASCKGSVSSLRSKAKKYGGERGKMYHWCANMKSGRKKK